MLDQDEEILIKQCIDWDRTAQKKLYERFCSKMFAVCLRYSSGREEAEDTLQEGFMKVFNNLVNFKSEGSLEGWIRRILVNTALEKFRKKKIQFVSMNSSLNGNGLNGHSNGQAHHEPVTTSDAIGHMEMKELLGLIQKLPPGCRTVFNLYVIDGFKHKEIAEQLGISEGTSKSNLSDARAMLQKALKKITIPAEGINH
jgi:RNA polymerase sigma factor (sigma-70 family)